MSTSKGMNSPVVPSRIISPDMLRALDPFYRATAEVLIEKGIWKLEKEVNL